MALSKYRGREEAAGDILLLLRELAERVEALRGRARWGGELEKALGELRSALQRVAPAGRL